MRTLFPILLRITAILCGLCLVAVLFQLVGRMLGILPPQLQGILASGWATVFQIVSPVLPALAAIGIVVLVVWLFMAASGRR
jgi:hypothetical protein